MKGTSKINVGLLLCDDVDESARAEFGTYTNMFSAGINAVDENLVLTPVQCYLGEIPDTPDDFDAYLISGSRYGVYEPRSWIAELEEFVRRCWDKQKKIVGVCFGHQLIAHALGGESRKSDVGWGLGIHATRITQPQDWMNRNELVTPDRYNLVVIHQDQVFSLPAGFTTIAENDFCPISMYTGGSSILGIQGHPEFDKKFCEYRIHYRKNILDPVVYQQALASLEQMELDSGEVLAWIARFIRQ